MISRRALIGATAAGAVVLLPEPASAVPTTIDTFKIEGSSATVALRTGPVAVVLLHVARRWHYEIAPLDTGEGGGVVGFTDDARGPYRTGTAIALHPTAYPANGSERLWPHQEEIVRDILVDCGGTVAWTPKHASHFQVTVGAADRTLAGIAARLERGPRTQTAGTVADPAAPERRRRR